MQTTIPMLQVKSCLPGRAVVRSVLIAAVALGAAAFAAHVQANTISITAMKDNTLYETNDGSLSNGAGPTFFAGRTGSLAEFRSHRGVLAFDVAGNVPAGATIESVTLTLHVLNSVSGEQPTSLHPLLADWGEGASNAGNPGGSGAAAQTNDATWLHTFFPGEFWNTPGGDFVATASATTNVGGFGASPTWSSVGMVADVQGWLDDPDGNFGWILIGNEAQVQSAKGFHSRQSSDVSRRPSLSITYSLPDLPIPGDANGDGVVNRLDLLIVLRNHGRSDADFATGDFNDDGNVNLIDLHILSQHLGAEATATAVPEPGAAMLAVCGVLAIGLVWRRRQRCAAP